MQHSLNLYLGLKMGTYLNQAYFWSAEADPSLTPIFFDPRWKNCKNWYFEREIPDPSNIKMTGPILGQKYLTQTHHYLGPMLSSNFFVAIAFWIYESYIRMILFIKGSNKEKRKLIINFINSNLFFAKLVGKSKHRDFYFLFFCYFKI